MSIKNIKNIFLSFTMFYSDDDNFYQQFENIETNYKNALNIYNNLKKQHKYVEILAECNMACNDDIITLYSYTIK